jgi:hypothetical protein
MSQARLAAVVAMLGLLPVLAYVSACGSHERVAADAGDDDGGPGAMAAVDAAPDASNDADADQALLYPAELPPSPPQILSFGGPIMKAPRLVPVFFADDDSQIVSSVEEFVEQVGHTSFWTAATSEYGVGPAVAEPAIHLSASDNPPLAIDDTAIMAWLGGKLDGDDPSFGVPDAETVYVLFYPAGVSVTLEGETSCVGFAGYHGDFQLGAPYAGQSVAYAVIPRCATFRGMHGLDVVTDVASHELIEAVTDPFARSNPAYLEVDDGHAYWNFFGTGTEVCDMCVQVDDANLEFAGLPFMVQRCWSNAAEAAGHDPCVPVPPGEVYFNSVPTLGKTTNTWFGVASF